MKWSCPPFICCAQVLRFVCTKFLIRFSHLGYSALNCFLIIVLSSCFKIYVVFKLRKNEFFTFFFQILIVCWHPFSNFFDKLFLLPAKDQLVSHVFRILFASIIELRLLISSDKQSLQLIFSVSRQWKKIVPNKMIPEKSKWNKKLRQRWNGSVLKTQSLILKQSKELRWWADLQRLRQPVRQTLVLECIFHASLKKCFIFVG